MTPGAGEENWSGGALGPAPPPASVRIAPSDLCPALSFVPWKGFQVVLAILPFISITLSGQSPTHADSYPEDLAGATHCLDSPFHPPAST